MNTQWLDQIKRLQALAQSGLAYSDNPYDIERYQELRAIGVQMMAEIAQMEIEPVRCFFANETGYQTPKVDVRSVIFQEQKMLLVREKADGAWALPGGWADIGYSAAEVAIKEAREEAGLEVKPVRILAVLDKRCNPHPPSPFYTYKIFFWCEIVSGTTKCGLETTEVGFFDRNHLPPLSLKKYGHLN